MAVDILTKTFISMRQRLLANARRLLADDDDADDALQDAFYRLWQRREQITTESQAEGLSMITVRNICIDNLRHKSSVRTEDIDVADIKAEEDTSERDELYDQVRSIIDSRLSERERLVITMRDSMGMDFEDIAAELSISEANVRLILSRARRTIREIYKNGKQE